MKEGETKNHFIALWTFVILQLIINILIALVLFGLHQGGR